jgi:hypothetical protein
MKVEYRKNHCLIVTSSLALLVVLLWAVTAFAAVTAGTVTHLSGPLFAKKADGSKKALYRNSVVEQGDTIITERRTYARIKFADGGEVTLRPGSQFKIVAFAYDQNKPKEDRALFDLVKGGLRAMTGFIGKRGNADSYKVKTPPAVIGIRGTIYEVKICGADLEGNGGGDCGSLPSGIYFHVLEGEITVSNTGGAQTVGAGQFAYAKDMDTPPVILPENPGIDFVPQKDILSTDQFGGCMVR